MTQEQLIHVGMINSFNLITERNTFEEIVTSDLSLFAHVPDQEIPLELIQLMIEYFQSFEMFEHCADLVMYLDLNYNEDGTRKQHGCECAQPVITGYSKKMFCGNCKKRLLK
jgi:hypothetical protein